MKSLFQSLRSFLIIGGVLSVAAAQPKIQMENAKIELGAIYHGEVKTIKLVVRNAGNQPLKITDIETSCGCTSAKENVPVIPPQGSETIDVTFNSMGFDGKIRKEVMLYSNDPASPMIYATLTGTVLSELETVPKMTVLNFGVSAVGEQATATFRLRNTSREQIVIKEIACALSGVAFQYPVNSIAPSDTITITVSYVPRSSSLIDQMFYVLTASPRQPRIPFRFIFAGK